MRCGQKIVQDVDQSTGQNIEYRDEHSSPFAWRSRSQQVVRDRYLLKNNQPTNQMNKQMIAQMNEQIN